MLTLPEHILRKYYRLWSSNFVKIPVVYLYEDEEEIIDEGEELDGLDREEYNNNHPITI